jgi:hypothetical protein
LRNALTKDEISLRNSLSVIRSSWSGDFSSSETTLPKSSCHLALDGMEFMPGSFEGKPVSMFYTEPWFD